MVVALASTLALSPRAVEAEGGEEWVVATDSGFVSDAFFDLTYAGGQYVGVGSGGAIIHSPDGDDWTEATGSDLVTDSLFGVAHSGARYVAGGDNGMLLYSDDGDVWVQSADAGVITTGDVDEVGYGGGRFVGVGDAGTLIYSDDGAAWTVAASSGVVTASDLLSVVHTGTQWVAVGAGGTILRSLDGDNWVAAADSGVATTATLQGIAQAGSRLVAVGSLLSNGVIIYSDDGADWTVALDASEPARQWLSVASNGHDFVATGHTSLAARIAHSPDGVTWTAATHPAGPILTGLAYGGRFVATGAASNGFIIHATLVVTTTTLPDGTEGVAYSQTLAAVNASQPANWLVTAGALPGGLTLDAATGEISGSPAAAGTFDFTAQVTDAAGAVDDQALTIVVAAAPPPPPPPPDAPPPDAPTPPPAPEPTATPTPTLTPEVETSFTAGPVVGGAGTSGDGCVRVEVSSAAVSSSTVFTLIGVGAPAAPLQTSHYIECGTRVVANLGANGQELTEFDDPFTVIFILGDEEQPSLGDADLAGRLTLAYWDGDGWIALPTTVDPATREVSAPSDGTGTFALLLLDGPFFMVPPEPGLTFTGLARVGAVTGAIDLELVREACPRVSLWITVGGRFEGYVFDAPPFVNRAFPEALSRGTLTIVRCH